jgi:hypothetical protein
MMEENPDNGILEKLKEKGRAWPFYTATKVETLNT